MSRFSICTFRFSKWLTVALVAVVCMVFADAAFAQGCAMCATSTSPAKASALEALRSGILILLIPALVMFAAIFVVIYRYRNRFAGAEESPPNYDAELRQMLAQLEAPQAPLTDLQKANAEAGSPGAS